MNQGLLNIIYSTLDHEIERLFSHHTEQNQGTAIYQLLVNIKKNRKSISQKMVSGIHDSKCLTKNKDWCEFCTYIRYCQLCQRHLNCKLSRSNCMFCGKYGKPISSISSAGILLIVNKNSTPCLLLVKEKWGKSKNNIGDIGGKFDPGNDIAIQDIIRRQCLEEAGISCQSGFIDQNTTQLFLKAYQLMITHADLDQGNKFAITLLQVYIDSVVFIPISEFKKFGWVRQVKDIHGKSFRLTSRLREAMKHRISNKSVELRSWLIDNNFGGGNQHD